MTKAAPFRADHVGSLLRPKNLLDARRKFFSGAIDKEALKEVEDAAVSYVVAKQEGVGLSSVTDGEYRRENWSLDFLSALDGIVVEEMEVAPDAKGSAAPISKKLPVARVVGKLGFSEHPVIEHFKYLHQATGKTAKLTIPCPTMLVSASRDWRLVVSKDVYADLDEFYEDLGRTYSAAVKALYDAGCRYLQFDDVNMSYLCDKDMRARIEARGDSPEALLQSWVKVLNASMRSRPADMTITTHICRGNFKSAWFASGGYEPIAESIFNELDYDGYFLEYDSDRAGGFEPLRFLPKGNKRVVLGLMTTKTGELENRDFIKARVDEATKYADLNQLCLSPQCGFASHEDGNLLSEDEQWAKLRQVVELADEIWG